MIHKNSAKNYFTEQKLFFTFYISSELNVYVFKECWSWLHFDHATTELKKVNIF